MSKEAMKLALERIADPRNTHFAGDAQVVARQALELAKQEHGEQDNYQGSDAAKAAHMMDLYTALGVRWGDDPFTVIANMRSIAETEKQERPTGPATSADRYFYDAGFEAGRLAGIKITLDEWAKSEPPVLAKQEHGEPVAMEKVYETIIHWDEGGGKRSRRELARRIVALYTTPQQRTWVGLTDDEAQLLRKKCIDTPPDLRDVEYGWAINYARAVEAKLKEKNGIAPQGSDK